MHGYPALGFTRSKPRRITIYVSEETYREWRRLVEEWYCYTYEDCLKKLLRLARRRLYLTP